MKLTATTIKTIALPPGVADKTFWDEDLGGFGLRLRAGGAARYVVQYDLGGKTKRITLGTTAMLDLSAARARAKDLLAGVRLGGDPASEKREARTKAAETFGAILPRYLAKMQVERRPRSFKELERHLVKYARPLHPRAVTSLDRRAISGLISAIEEKSGPSAAIHAHGSLSGYFGWLMREGLLEQNPILYTNKPEVRPSRERVVSDDELRVLWRALGNGDYFDIVRLLTYTGCRRDEIGGLLWDEVDLDKAQLDIPAWRMKGNKPHLVPLSEPALAILAKRTRGDRNHVFGCGAGGFQGWSRCREDLDSRIAGPRPTWTLHDLRRSLSTAMHEKLGIAPHIVERVLAHVGHQAGVAGRYNKSDYIDEKRRALERWAEYVDETILGAPSKVKKKVVNLRGQRSL
jgi:integrase